MLTALAFGAACVPWRCWPRPVAGRRPDRPLSLGRLGMWFAAGAGVCVRSARARTLTRGEAESWRERRGLVGQELEGWPCSSGLDVLIQCFYISCLLAVPISYLPSLWIAFNLLGDRDWFHHQNDRGGKVHLHFQGN